MGILKFDSKTESPSSRRPSSWWLVFLECNVELLGLSTFSHARPDTKSFLLRKVHYVLYFYSVDAGNIIDSIFYILTCLHINVVVNSSCVFLYFWFTYRDLSGLWNTFALHQILVLLMIIIYCMIASDPDNREREFEITTGSRASGPRCWCSWTSWAIRDHHWLLATHHPHHFDNWWLCRASYWRVSPLLVLSV